MSRIIFYGNEPAISRMAIYSGRPQGGRQFVAGDRKGGRQFVAGDRKGSPLQIGYLGGCRGFASTKLHSIPCTGNLTFV
jgi:hypothetical protein